MKKIVISEFMDESAADTLRPAFDVVYEPGLVDDKNALLAALANADALIVRNRTKVTAEMLKAAPQLKVVGRLGVGLDNIDTAACKASGVAVIPATGANALAVAEYVIGTAMVLLRGTYLSTTEVTAGQWPRPRLSNGRETAGKVLGLIGFGGIGQLTAKLATALGMQVIAHDPMVADNAPVWAEYGVGNRGIDDLIAQSDVVSLHIPLTDATRGMFNAERIARMKAGAVLVNTARGGIVDEGAVAQALIDGRLAGAALDVFDVEPLPAGTSLAAAPNLILTPHIGGVTVESNDRVSSMIADRVAASLNAN